jgi:uncharacterized protein
MGRVLRGHHLLCVHGFRGMGYSPEFVEKMQDVVTDIRDDEKSFTIQTVIDLDETCDFCPHKGEGFCNADPGSDAHVKGMDAKVLEHLGLQHREFYDKDMLVRLVAEKVQPDDLDILCAGCSWLSFGVCKEGIQQLKEKYNQRPDTISQRPE